LQSGDEYDLIKKTISIVIAGEIFLREHNEYHDVFTLYSRITKTEFTDILEIHTLELPLEACSLFLRTDSRCGIISA